MTVRKAASAGLWSSIDIGARFGVQFVVSVLLARLLAPADFGIIALLTFFSSLSMVFVQGGLSTALIQRQSTTREEESAVFWWNLGASLVFAATLLAIAPAVARFYAVPVLRPLMLAAAAQVVLSALGAVQTALLSRELQFAALAKAGVAATAVSGALGIGAAVAGLGVWSLAIQLVSQTALNSALLWRASTWRPSAHFNPASLVALWRFGAWLSLSSALEVLYSQGFALIVGKLHGARDLGLYSRAASTQQLPANVTSAIIGRIALPLFASRAEDPEALRRGLRMANGLAMLVNLPVMAGVAILSDLVVLVLFGEKWLPAAPILAILAWGGLIFPLHVLNLQVLLAQGRSDTFFRLEVAKKAVGILAVAIGSLYGIIGLAYSQFLLGLVALFINVAPIGRALGYGVGGQLRDLGAVIGMALAMSLVLLLLRPLLTFSPLANLTILVTTGAISYSLVGLVFRPEPVRDMWTAVRLALRREAPITADRAE